MPGMAMNIFNPAIGRQRQGKSVTLRPAWSTHRTPTQPELDDCSICANQGFPKNFNMMVGPD